MNNLTTLSIKSAPSLLKHANKNFNNLNEPHLDSNVHLSTSITQISTFKEQTCTSTMLEHLQGPNASMCSTAALPNSLVPPQVATNAPKELLCTSKAPNQPLCTPMVQISPRAPRTLTRPPPNYFATKTLNSQLT